MTEKLHGDLELELGSKNSANKAYLDLWRTLDNAGFDVGLVPSNGSNLPKVRERKGSSAYITQSALISAYKAGDKSLARKLNEYRAKKGSEVFGGLSNTEVQNLIESQLHSSWKERRNLHNMIGRLPLKVVQALPIAVGAQVIDKAQSTPDVMQGHLKDVIAVPMISYITHSEGGSTNKRALLVGALLTGTEFLQRYDPTNTWTFDPKDIIAYGVGTAAVIGFNEVRKVVKQRGQTSVSTETTVS